MSTTPPVIQHAATPPGNIPKGRQTYIMIGVALVIVLAIVFSGSATTGKVKAGTNLPPLAVTPLTKRDIDGLEMQLKAAEAQAKLQEAALRNGTSAGVTPTTAGSTNTGLQGGISGQGITAPDGKVYYPSKPAPVNIVAQEKAQMEFTSLFASPIAFSLRPAAAIPPISPATGTVAPTPASAAQPAPAPAVASAQPVEDRTPQHVLFEGRLSRPF